MINKYLNFQPFTEAEARTLFRLAAIGEAAGWTVLITGLALSHFLHNSLPVLISGQFHGVLFLIYFAMTTAVAPSIKWGIRKILLALACGVPPYGSLFFEFWQSFRLNQVRISNVLFKNYLLQSLLPDSEI